MYLLSTGSLVHTKTVRSKTDEAEEELRDWYECSDWVVLCEPHGEDINTVKDCFTV